jgi:hypothetical protein
VSDRTWPTIFGDDVHFVLYYKGNPVAEYSGGSTRDASSGQEPSCLSSCEPSATSGLAPAYVGSSVASNLSSSALASGPVAPSLSAVPVVVAQAKVVGLAPTTRSQVPGGVDLDVVSDTEFPVGDAGSVLRVGQVEVVLSAYPDPSDMRRLTFTFSADQVAQLKGGEAVSIQSGPRQWDAGVLDVTFLKR